MAETFFEMTSVNSSMSSVNEDDNPVQVSDDQNDSVMENSESLVNEELQTSAENKDNSSAPPEKLVQLPMSRIKYLMKMDPTVNLASQEAVFLITRCTELFIESLARESYLHTSQAKRKTVQRKDMDQAISSSDGLEFLEGALPVD